MNRDTLLLLIFPVLVCLPAIIIGFISKWRDKQADKEEANQALA